MPSISSSGFFSFYFSKYISLENRSDETILKGQIPSPMKNGLVSHAGSEDPVKNGLVSPAGSEDEQSERQARKVTGRLRQGSMEMHLGELFPSNSHIYFLC